MGIGLRNYQNAPSAASDSGTSTTSTLNYTVNTDWRLDPSEYVLDTSWDSSAEPTTRVYNLTISEIVAWPDGFQRIMTVINGQYPGPLIECNSGDRLIVNVINNSVNETTIHFHGIYQNGTNYMDGVQGITQCSIPSGGSFTYNFTITDDQYGTYWYHSHYGPQYSDGVLGPMVIHSPIEDEYIGDLYDTDQIVLIQDYYHDISFAYLEAYLAPDNENTEPVPDNGLINGGNFFNCSKTPDNTCYQNISSRAYIELQENKKHRLRIINVGSFAEIEFSIDSHPLSLVEADGSTVKPITYHKIKMSVAQRYSVIVNANQTNDADLKFWMRAEINQYCFATTNPVLDTGVKALVKYTNTTIAHKESVGYTNSIATTDSWDDVAANVKCLDFNNTEIEPFIAYEPPAHTHAYRFDSSFQIKGNQLDRGYINGTSWYPADYPTLLSAYDQLNPTLNESLTNSNSSDLLNTFGALPLGIYNSDQYQYVANLPDYAVVDVLLNNLDDGSHPFHLHGYKFWVLGAGSGNYHSSNKKIILNTQNPIMRDTVGVQGYGWVLVRFIADNPGIWAFHCHITWHVEAGLMMQFQTMSSKIGEFQPPDEWRELCSA
ncbi:multicopper oxidase-domain-containing protein [Lipomyces oligophaga]|uniref:multicopper oxidase-domain-containing protein n=1 Tax=Lipomyces oligophaga TaxID=45792 RepID=UPI0034CFE527